MRGMPPGDYYIATVLDPEFGDWFKPGFMQQLEPMLRVTLGAEEKKVQHLRVPGWQAPRFALRASARQAQTK